MICSTPKLLKLAWLNRVSYQYCIILFSMFIWNKCQAQNRVNMGVVPSPAFVESKPGSFLFTSQVIIVAKNVSSPTVDFLRKFLLSRQLKNVKVISIGHTVPKGLNIILLNETFDKLVPEGYTLEISSHKIMINGNNAGLFYGIQTLMQLFPDEGKGTVRLPCLLIKDAPHYAYRGLMLDVSRHFFTVAQIKDLLDLMAYYKLNRFHWHLTDDQGWRIEIKSFPRLTSVGAWRVARPGDFEGFVEPPKPGEKASDGAFYTQEQIRDVIRYAHDRHISVMPEIDAPGHSMALIASYPELCVTKDTSIRVNPGSSFAKWFKEGRFEMYVDNTLNPTDEHVYQFLDKVFGEVAALFPYEYIHIGGDECYKGYWERDKGVQAFMKANNIQNGHQLQSYFINRLNKIIQSKNKKMIGWDEVLDGGMIDDITIMNRFGEKRAADQIKKNASLILAPGNSGFYFDYQQSLSEMEPSSHGGYSPLWKSYTFDPDYKSLSADERKKILGVEGCIWTEHIFSVNKLNYMLLPRLLGLSETAWSEQKNKDYNQFAEHILPGHLQSFDKVGINYRVPTPLTCTDTTIIASSFTFKAEATVTNSKVYYSLNNSQPSEADHLYTEPVTYKIPVGKQLTIKAIVITPSGKRSLVSRINITNLIENKE